MKKTQAFAETRNNKTALVVLGDESMMGTYFCVQIEHEGGAYQKHPVTHHMTFKGAMDAAEEFLSK